MPDTFIYAVVNKNVMVKILFCIPIVIAIIIFIVECNDEDDPKETFVYRKELVKSVTKVINEGEVDLEYYFQMRKLCSNAKNVFSLPYIDDDADLEVRQYKFTYVNEKNAFETQAIHCHTLPATYIRPGDYPNEVIVTMIQSSAHEYKFDTEDNILPVSVNLFVGQTKFFPVWMNKYNKKDSKKLEESKTWKLSNIRNLTFPNLFVDLNDVLPKFNLHERQNLCLEARKHLVFAFVDNYVNDFLVYEFVYKRESRIYNALLCPTYPPVYLHFHTGVREKRMTIIYFETTFSLEVVEDIRPKEQEEYESMIGWENELMMSILRKFRGKEIKLVFKGQNEKRSEDLNEKLLLSLTKSEIKEFCTDGERHLRNAPFLASNIQKPSYYLFDYGDGLIIKRLAIRCSSDDEMFFYSENNVKSGTNIKIALRKQNLIEKSNSV